MSIKNAVHTVTVVGEKITPIPDIYKGTICADLSNTGIVYIGDEIAQDFPIEQGNALDLTGEVIMQMYVRGDAGDKLIILGTG